MPRFSRFTTAALAGALAATPLAASADSPSSRVIISSTLNHGLLVLDAETLAFTQTLHPSRGTSPVRMDVESIEGRPYLFTANHGIAGSLGIFDLSGDLVLESPASPLPTGGMGSVGVDAAHGYVAVTNTWFALGGCGMPKGSVSAFRVGTSNGQLVITPRGVHDLTGSIPYAVSIDHRHRIHVAVNCSDDIQTFRESQIALPTGTLQWFEPEGRTAIGDGPDATLFDDARDRSYTVNIGGDSISVVDGATRQLVTTVPMPNSGPIDAALATSAAGSDWILTGNGQDDTIGVVDRDVIESCIAASAAQCPQAVVARVPAGVSGGQPEGITYDPVSGRVFVVNKSPIGSPSVSVVELTESEDGISDTLVGVVPLPAVDPALPVPAIIAFDAVVNVRA